MNCESGVLSVIATPFGPRCLTDTMFVPARVEADDVHRLVLLAGGEAVDHVGSGQRLAVRPLRRPCDLERQRLVAVAPLPALREPRIDVAATGDRRDDERLVDRALHEAAVRAAEPVYGLKLRMNAGSPEPVMTRHACARRPALPAARASPLRLVPGSRQRPRPRRRRMRSPDRSAWRELDSSFSLPPLVALQTPAAARWMRTAPSRRPRPGGGSLSYCGPLTSRPASVTFTRSFQRGQGLAKRHCCLFLVGLQHQMTLVLRL